jgi:hypothetical protein
VLLGFFLNLGNIAPQNILVIVFHPEMYVPPKKTKLINRESLFPNAIKISVVCF